MWSADFTGCYGTFTPQQRVLFPVRDSAEKTKKCMLRALQHGTCTGIAVLHAHDRDVLAMVRQTLLAVYAKNAQLHRSDYTVCITTSPTWPVEALYDRVRDVLGHLQSEKLDVLLLARPTELFMTLSTSQRKRAVLQHWDVMCEIHRRGLVVTIGLSDFSTQEMEFIFTSAPTRTPTVLSTEATLQLTRSASSTAPSDIPLRRMLSFAYGRRMDVVVRFAFRRPGDLSPNTSLHVQWRQVIEAIATRQQAKQFEVAVVHEADAEPYHMEKRDMADTSTLQTSTQIIVRYFLQHGAVFVPIPDTEDTEDQFTEEETHDIFYTLMHPFTEMPPAHSPQVQYSSVLSKEDMQLIDQVLPLVVSFPAAQH